MRKTGLILMVVAMVMIPLTFTTFAAPVEEAGVYVVQKGDTLWWLEGLHRGDPRQWLRIVDDNEFLKEPGRIFTKEDKTIVLIKPGEQLKGLIELGILPREVPLSDLQVAVERGSSKLLAWLYLLFGIAIIVTLYGLYRLSRVYSDPATAGQPIVRGGISIDRTRDIETHFQRIAESRIASGEPMPQRVSQIEAGFLSGFGRVQYRDRSEMKRLKREPGYRARFRFANGTEEDLYFLQRCANDVTLYGTRYLGFTFKSVRQLVVEPQVQTGPRVPLRVAATGEPVVAVAKLEINGLEITAPEGTIFTVTSDKISIIVSRAGDITIGRIKKIKKAKVTKPAAAAVS